MPHTGNPAFTRNGTSNELRQECPRHVLNVLDAVSIARDITRTALVNEILGEFAKKKLHESSLIQKLTSGNPTDSDTTGGAA